MLTAVVVATGHLRRVEAEFRAQQFESASALMTSAAGFLQPAASE
jgi:hypothetical protein